MTGEVPPEIAGWVKWAKARGPVRDVKTGRVGVLVYFPIPAPYRVVTGPPVRGRSGPVDPIMETSDGLKRRVPTHRLEPIPVEIEGAPVPVSGVVAAGVRGIISAVRLAAVTAPVDVVPNWITRPVG